MQAGMQQRTCTVRSLAGAVTSLLSGALLPHLHPGVRELGGVGVGGRVGASGKGGGHTEEGQGSQARGSPVGGQQPLRQHRVAVGQVHESTPLPRRPQRGRLACRGAPDGSQAQAQCSFTLSRILVALDGTKLYASGTMIGLDEGRAGAVHAINRKFSSVCKRSSGNLSRHGARRVAGVVTSGGRVGWEEWPRTLLLPTLRANAAFTPCIIALHHCTGHLRATPAGSSFHRPPNVVSVFTRDVTHKHLQR